MEIFIITTFIGIIFILFFCIIQYISWKKLQQTYKETSQNLEKHFEQSANTPSIQDLKDMKQTLEASINTIQKTNDTSSKLLIDTINHQITQLDNSLNNSLNFQLSQLQDTTQKQQDTLTSQIRHLSDVNEKHNDDLKSIVDKNIKELTGTVSHDIKDLKDENSRQLQEIKGTVDEQLQSTLDRKLKESFDSVVKQLSSVERGLGEMQALASSVGDLKKTLSNVKTRGTLGELRLGAILEQMLAPGQYETNIPTVKGSRNPVEFAIKLPGKNDEDFIYLLIDSKYPGDTYNSLLEAYEKGDKKEIDIQKKLLENRILQEAKDISSKYIHVPETTDFGILFLPIEGLYAEVVSNTDLIEKLQQKYKINITGPTTMAALLNSLQMGFRTLAIQKSSSEVWDMLGNVKSEFNNFISVLENVQKKLKATDDELEKLVGVRMRQMKRQLDKVSTYQDSLDNNK